MSPQPLPPLQRKPEFVVTHQGETHGPFEPDFIEAMIMARVYPSTVLVQKLGTTDWIPFSSLGSSKFDLADQNTTGPNPCRPSPEIGGPAQRKKQKPEIFVAWIVGAFAVFVVLWIIGLVTSSKPSPKNQLPNSTSQSYSSTAPASHTQLAAPRSQNLTSRFTPQPRKTADDTQIYRDSYGRTYRVPSAAYSRLLSMKSALSVKQSRLDVEQSQLKSLANQVDRDRIYLDQTSQYEVDAFNRKVNQVNSLNSRVQVLVNDFNRDVDAFNSELERVGTPIN